MKTLFLFLLLFTLQTGVQSLTQTQSKSVSRLGLQWIGGPTTLLNLGAFRFLTDPMLSQQGDSAFILPKHPSTGQVNALIRRITAIPAFRLSPLDAVLISHDHTDHFDREAKKQLDKGTLLIVLPNTQKKVQKEGFRNVVVLDWNESYEVKKASETVRITAVKAFRAHDSTLNAALGKGNGYIMQYTNNLQTYTIYWTGDSIWQEDLKEVKTKFPPIDLLLPYVGAVGQNGTPGFRTMDAQEALQLVEFIRPTQVIPIHHTTFGHYVEPMGAFEKLSREKGYSAIIRILAEGESVDLRLRNVTGVNNRTNKR
jgi:L-ascorbate metabolism protein UlaG (beta-lactamase superfamily)